MWPGLDRDDSVSIGSMVKPLMLGILAARGNKASPSSESFLLCHGHCMSAYDEAEIPWSRPWNSCRTPSADHLSVYEAKRRHAPKRKDMSSDVRVRSISEDERSFVAKVSIAGS